MIAEYGIIEYAEANDTLVIALSKPSQSLRITYYGLLLLLLGAVYWASLSIVDISVHAVGSLRPAQGVQVVQSSSTAYLAAVRVQENQWVNAGDTLAVLDAEALTQKDRFVSEKCSHLSREVTDVRNVQALNTAAVFNFPLYANELAVKLKERDMIVQEIKTLETKLKRQEELYAKKFVSAEDYEQAKFQFQQKDLSLKQWAQNHTRSTAERIQQSELQLVELQSERKGLAIEKNNTILRAPTAGFVSTLAFKTPHVLVKAGEPICTISPNEAQIAEFYVSPRDIGLVIEGLTVKYQMEAFPFQEWGMLTGKVATVAKDCTVNERSTPAAQFKVTGSFDTFRLQSLRQSKTAVIKSGMTYRANIVIGQKRLITMLWDKSVDFFAL